MKRIKTAGGDIYMADDVDALLAKLRKHVGHGEHCARFIRAPAEPNECDCGLDALISLMVRESL